MPATNYVSKKEKRAQLALDMAAYAAAGGAVEVIPTQKTTIKVVCHGKKANNFVVGGSVPRLKLSSVFNQD